jgi:hypothetical protein
MILRTVKALIARFKHWLGVKLVRFGFYLTDSSNATILKLKAEKFAPFKNSSNHGKEIITIIEDDDLGPIYKN